MDDKVLVNKVSRGVIGRQTVVLLAGVLVALVASGVPAAHAAGIVVQPSPNPNVSSVVVVPLTGGAGPQVTFGLQAMDTDPPPTQPLAGEPPQICQGSNPSWTWSAQV